MRQAVGLSIRPVSMGVSWPGARAAAVLLIIAAITIRIVYLTNQCPLELAADEAHYWDWSRHLDWSYYSKGPLVAWLIRLSCELFGSFSERTVGSLMLAIRIPAVICHFGLLAGIYVLALRILRSETKALATLAVALTFPILAASGTVMTIDAPFSCCWVWALVFGHAAMIRGKNLAWLALGLIVGCGILAKYTMVLWLPCAAAFLLTARSYRRMLLQPGFWIACGLALVCCMPIVIWNMQHDWITVKHVGTQATGVEKTWRWLGPLRFLGEQMGVMLFYWFLPLAGAWWVNRPGKATEPGRQYLWWFSAPVFGLFLFTSLRTPGQINWPIAGYISGLILAVDFVIDRWHRANLGMRRIMASGFVLATFAGLSLTTITHFPHLMRPVLLAVSGQPTEKNPMPLRRFDPTARLRGWRHLAVSIDAIQKRLRDSGDNAIIGTSFWTLPAEIAVYCEGHPEVYCFGTALKQRMSQYDLWRPNPVWDPQQFAGRTVIYVGDVGPELAAAFESLEQTERIVYSEGGQPLVYWNVTIGRGFRGFGDPDKWTGQRRY